MARKRYTDEQIVRIVKERESGVPMADLKRKYGFSDASFYKWKQKFGGLELSDVKRLKALTTENERLKRMVAEYALDNAALKDALGKKW